MGNTHETPDLPTTLGVWEARKLIDRESFRVGSRTFVRVERGEYADDNITVFCDQQDLTAWSARIGAVRTAYFWTPEAAVKCLLGAVAP